MNSSNEQNPVCNQLEDWLFGLLSEEASAQFRQHLSSCKACGDAAAAEMQMKDVLKASASQCNVPPSSKVLRDRVQDRNATRRPQRRLVVLTVLAALAACAVFSIWPVSRSTPDEPALAEFDNRTEANQNTARNRSPTVRVDDDLVGVRLDSGDPDVVVVLTFPGWKVTRVPAEPAGVSPEISDPFRQEMN